MVEARPIVYRVSESGCHEVISHKPNDKGYPVSYFNGKHMTMHRGLFIAEHGWTPAVRHKCDNRLCIRMDHLEGGTKGDNNRDRMHRGRSRPRRGEDNGRAKLSIDQISAIRKDSRPSRAVAADYGVVKSTINYIRSGQTWK